MRYEFTLTLVGEGNSPEEAWEDTVDAFCCDPGWYDKYTELPPGWYTNDEEEDDEL